MPAETRPNAAAADLRYAARLLPWYDRHARSLPWRVSPQARAQGEQPQAYRVWLSEIMLQQTTVEAVKPYFARFIRQWPNLAALSAAPTEDIMKAWAGLGYYSRARNLIACAGRLMAEYGGSFPRAAAELRRLPGIGPYTAAAIAAIAFDEPCAVVDANIERVVARLFACAAPLPAAKGQIAQLCQSITPPARAGDFAQGMMDLGAGLCSPRRPACALCPLAELCLGRAQGIADSLPRKAPKKARGTRRGAAFIIADAEGRIYLEKRGNSGLLGGMSQPPNYFAEIAEGAAKAAAAAAKAGAPDAAQRAADLAQAPFAAGWHYCGKISHIFTHFRLELNVYKAAAPTDFGGNGFWVKAPELPHEALPTVFKKAFATALPEVFKPKSAAKKPAGK